MQNTNVEIVFLKLLKRIMLLIIGSGLLTNALYIYGQGYYQGYIGGLGFDYALFPIEWDDALIWTYSASRELGLTSIILLDKISLFVMIILLLGFYLLARLWMEISEKKSPSSLRNKKRKIKYKWAKKIYHFRSNHNWLYRFFYVPLRWFLIKEQSFIAFLASYFFMVFLFFVPLFVIIWVYFPLFGLSHGESVAEQRIKFFESNLCGGDRSYWSECIQIQTLHLKNYSNLKNIKGRLIFKNGSLIGLFTDNGPVTLTMPKEYYYATVKNPCYKGGCKKSGG